jgi:mono/diheme cytochrome c family protein
MRGLMTHTVKSREAPGKRSGPTGEVRPSAKWRIPRTSDYLLVLFLCACSAGGVLLAQTTEALDRGRNIYQEHCLDCHGVTGKGDGSKSPFLSPRPGNLISAATSAKTDKELLRIIAQGKSRTAMPAWQDVLPADDQQAVLQYIRSLVRFTRLPGSTAATP